MAKPKVLRYGGTIQVPRERTADAPDTLKLLLVGDSAVTLNTATVRHYSREEAQRLRKLVAMQAMLPSTPLPDSARRKR